MNIFITGTAGFIGFHVAKSFLDQGEHVWGYDGLTPYYDVTLKRKRHEMLFKYPHFSATEALLEDAITLEKVIHEFKPDVIIHLAAQAGVRYSLENPKAYLDANLIGTFNLLEVVKKFKPQHLLMASTSSVYGDNDRMPFVESCQTDHPLTLYAATKKANEVMAHAYAHINHIPTTLFRFFTVYGPWGRPDMALFKFTQGILEGKPIDVYNYGHMQRDFTYIDDLVIAIKRLVSCIPEIPGQRTHQIVGDTLSSVAPYRIVNIGNSQPVKLLDFIQAIEEILNKKANCHYMPMQMGDVPATWADSSLLKKLTQFQPQTSVKQGVKEFIRWYREYYQV